MVTGIESAGLVLAAFPLAIEALRVYVRGVDRVRKMRAYHSILEVFLQDLEFEKFLFENLCENLLGPFCQPDEIQELIANPGGPLWLAERIQDILQPRLIPRSIHHFLRVAKSLDEELRGLASKFQVDISDSDSAKANGKDVYKKIRMHLVQAFKTGMLSEYYEERIGRIRTLNGNLRRLQVHGNQNQEQGPTPISNSQNSNGQVLTTATKTVEYLNRIRRQAKSIYAIFKEQLNSPSCKCDTEASHGISLQLEMRTLTINTNVKRGAGLTEKDPSQLFTLMVSNEGRVKPWCWKEIQLEPTGLYSDSSQGQSMVQNSRIGYGFTEGQNSDTASPKPNPPVQWQPDLTLTLATNENNNPIALGHAPHALLQVTKPGNEKRVISALVSPKYFGDKRGTQEITRGSFAITSVFRRDNSLHIDFKRPSPAQEPAPEPHSVESSLMNLPTSQVKVMFPQNNIMLPQTPPITSEQEISSASAGGPSAIACFSSLCDVVMSAGRYGHGVCLGLLKSPSEGGDQEQFRVWTPEQCTLCVHPAEVTSLHFILGPHFNRGRLPSLQSRLALGIKLASSVIQLHETEWLPEHWRSTDIVFSNNEIQSRKSVLSRPLVKGTLSSQQRTICSPKPTVNSKLWQTVPANPSLYSLGIVLIELLYWEKLEVLRDKFGLPSDHTDEMMSRHITAMELVDGFDTFLTSDAYAQVVRRCLVGLHHKTRSLDRDDFKSEAYSLVVQPLEENLRKGWGSSC